MKKTITILLCIITIFSFSTYSYAHPGSLDANGGHYNRSTGEYHYHHGYSAHQHPNGMCPYNFDDKTNDSYNNSSTTKKVTNTKSSSERFVFEWTPETEVYVYKSTYHSYHCRFRRTDCKNYLLIDAVQEKLSPCGICSPGTLTQKQIDEYLTSATNKDAESSKESNDPNYFWGNLIIYATNFLGITLCIFFMGILIVGLVISAFENRKIKSENKEKQSFQRKSNDEMYSHYFSIYSFYHPLDFVQVPEGSFLKDGLPATKGRRKYGDYTVYITPHGECFHQNSQCSKHLKTSNYIYAYNRRPCKRCVKDIPEIQWYLDIVKIQKIKKEYNIP